MSKCEGKITLGRPSLKYEDDNKADLEEIVFENLDWIHVALIGFSGRLT
jgi:hypothetical protein